MTRAADIARADVEESKRSGPPDSAAGRGWSAVILVVTDLFDYLDWQQQRPRGRARGKGGAADSAAPCLRAAGSANHVGCPRRWRRTTSGAGVLADLHTSLGAPLAVGGVGCARGGRTLDRPVRDPTTGTPPESCRADRPEHRRAVKERNAQIYATIRLVS